MQNAGLEAKRSSHQLVVAEGQWSGFERKVSWVLWLEEGQYKFLASSPESGSLLKFSVRYLQVGLALRNMCWGREERESEERGE